MLRAILTNYSYSYRSKDEHSQPLDEASFVERQLLGEFGSYSRYGAFIIGSTLQLGAELNKKGRCVEDVTPTGRIVTKRCRDLELVTSSRPEVYSLSSPFHPVVLSFTFSLGVAF